MFTLIAGVSACLTLIALYFLTGGTYESSWWLLWLTSIFSGVTIAQAYSMWKTYSIEKNVRKVILVDMDNVLANWDYGWDKALISLSASGVEHNIPLSGRRTQFNVFDTLSRDDRLLVSQLLCSPGFYASLPIMEGAKLALTEMLKAGYDVRIVTSPWISNPTCASDKLNWVVTHLGSSWAQRTVITVDKTLVRGDWLIDDKPEIKGSVPPTWEHIWFDAPVNQGLTGRRRIAFWSDWRKVIEA